MAGVTMKLSACGLRFVEVIVDGGAVGRIGGEGTESLACMA